MTNEEKELRTSVLLSVQRALLLEIFPSTSSIYARISRDAVELEWFVDGPISDNDRNSVTTVEAEIDADFGPGFLATSRIIEGTGRGVHRDRNPMVVCVFARRPW